MNLSQSIQNTLEDAELWGSDGILPCHVENQNTETKLAVITGSNASGKSLACRIIAKDIVQAQEQVKKQEVEFFHIGMRMRTENTAGISARTFVYGSEGNKSTGATSVNAVLKMFEQSRKRNNLHLIALDEPDIGLSDEYALAFGEEIRRFVSELPGLCIGVLVVSHNKALVGCLMQDSPIALRFGSNSTLEWLNQPLKAASLLDLEGLVERNKQTFSRLERLFRERRNSQSEHTTSLGM